MSGWQRVIVYGVGVAGIVVSAGLGAPLAAAAVGTLAATALARDVARARKRREGEG